MKRIIITAAIALLSAAASAAPSASDTALAREIAILGAPDKATWEKTSLAMFERAHTGMCSRMKKPDDIACCAAMKPELQALIVPTNGWDNIIALQTKTYLAKYKATELAEIKRQQGLGNLQPLKAASTAVGVPNPTDADPDYTSKLKSITAKYSGPNAACRKH